jgi:hypothetical protein
MFRVRQQVLQNEVALRRRADSVLQLKARPIRSVIAAPEYLDFILNLRSIFNDSNIPADANVK